MTLTKAEQDRLDWLRAGPENYQTDAEREEMHKLLAKRDADSKNNPKKRQVRNGVS
jgi:hypothetical protein